MKNKNYFYQPIYKDRERIDAEFNSTSSLEVYAKELDAWLSLISDCETDEDIAFIMRDIAQGVIGVQRIKVKNECDEL